MPDLDYFQWGYRFKPMFAINAVIAGTWGFYLHASQYLNGAYTNSSTHALNDEVQFKFSHKAGAYTLRLLCLTASAYAIVTISIDGVPQGTIDLWSAVAAYNVIKTLAVTIVKDGEHTLNIKATGTTGGDYYITISAWWLTD